MDFSGEEGSQAGISLEMREQGGDGMMRKQTISVLAFMVAAAITACGSSTDVGDMAGVETKSTEAVLSAQESTDNSGAYEETKAEDGRQITVSQGGAFGRISVTLPSDWQYETCPAYSDTLQAGMYGIQFRPQEVSAGYVELCYMESFGVCGTGLAEETVTLAGESASIGRFDGHAYWDFVSFGSAHGGIVAFTHDVDDAWWDEYGEQVSGILNTLRFDRDEREGAAAIEDAGSKIAQIGLELIMDQITPTGAKLSFFQSGGQPEGELEFGDTFVIEKLNDGTWEEMPLAVTGYPGGYGFHDIAYTIAREDVTGYEQNWDVFYGELPAGEYRIGKEIFDFRGTGDFDTYTVYGRFVIY